MINKKFVNTNYKFGNIDNCVNMINFFRGVNMINIDNCVNMINFWLNCSFSPLIFPKLWFWPPKKKNYKTAP